MFNVQIIDLDHSGGTKQYHLVCIVDADRGEGIAVARWGKTGTWGELMTEEGSAAKVQKFVRDKQRSKEGRGYSTKSNRTYTCKSQRDLETALGDYWDSIGAPLTTLLRGAEFEADISSTEDEIVTEPPAPEPPKESASKNNPKWGLF
jgi:predicted DNA-binding WGR domain protein